MNLLNSLKLGYKLSSALLEVAKKDLSIEDSSRLLGRYNRYNRRIHSNFEPLTYSELVAYTLGAVPMIGVIHLYGKKSKALEILNSDFFKYSLLGSV